VAAGSAPHSQRAQALLALDEGATQAEAGRLAGLTRNQVSYWLRQFRQRRLDIFPADQLKPALDKPAADLPETPAAPEPPGEEEAKAAKKSKKGKPAKKKKSVTAKSKKKEGKKSKKKKTKKKKKGKKKKKKG
jgi:transposase-like protein